MKIKLKFFGRLSELTDTNELIWETEESATLSEIEDQLNEKYPDWTAQVYRIAVNQEMVDVVTLKDGDEVAFLPPFAGG